MTQDVANNSCLNHSLYDAVSTDDPVIGSAQQMERNENDKQGCPEFMGFGELFRNGFILFADGRRYSEKGEPLHRNTQRVGGEKPDERLNQKHGVESVMVEP